MNKYYFSFLCLCTSFLASGLFAQDGDLPPPPQQEQGIMQIMIMMGIGIAFFYLILIRPEQKRAKDLEEMRGNMQKGARVAAMGIVGTVLRVQEDTVILKMYDGSKLEFLKGAVSEVTNLNDEQESEKEESSNKNSKRVQLTP
jgi:preprotein translocase subunit YajC